MRLLAFTAMLFAVAQAFAQPCTNNQVVNGSFETTIPAVPPNTPNNALNRLTGIPGWTTTVGNTLEVWGNIVNALPASAGTNHMEVNAQSNDQTVTQTITNLSTNCPAQLCFDYTGRFGIQGSNYNNDFTFSVSGGYSHSVGLNPPSYSIIGWTNYCISFTPTSPTITISFRSHPHYTNGIATQGGVHIDNVSLFQCCTNLPCDVLIDCPTNKTVPCGSVWSFDVPVVVSNSCCETNFFAYTTTTNNSSCPVITRNWTIWDNCGNSNTCSQSVSLTDTTPPTFVGGCNTNVYWGDTNDNFLNPTASSPRPALLARLQGVRVTPTRNFDECAVNKWFAHSFTNLPKCITAATLEIRLKPCGDICDNDAMHLWFTGSANSNAVFSQYFGSGQARAGLATNGWCSYANDPQTFILDLANLPASGGGAANILAQLEANGFLDVTVQDDTAVDYVKLTVVSCCGNSTKTVECGTQWFFDTPVAVDDCCPNPTVTVLNTVTNGICPKVATRTWLATDCCGNTNSVSQVVTMVDTKPPVIRTPGNIKRYTCNPSMIVKFKVTATDACYGNVTPNCTPASGSTFPVGTTTVTCTATDACGNSSTNTFTVTVVNQFVSKTLTGGIKDCFTLPEEPATRSAQLNAAYPLANWKNFDSLAQDRPFGYSFMKLPKNLTCARLEIRMRPGASTLTTNDAIAAVLGTNGAFAWSSYIGAGFPSGSLTPAVWRNQTNCGETFTIDLGAYLATINQLNQVDVYVQDDTAVDYVSLTYCYCDTGWWWRNWDWYPGNADAAVSTDWLTLTPVAANSNLTATVNLSGATGVKLNMGNLDLSAANSGFTFGAGSIANPSGSAVTLRAGASNSIGLSVSAHGPNVNSVRIVAGTNGVSVSDTTITAGAAASDFLLIEAENGIITVEDWQITASTESRLVASNGVEAAYTIEFNHLVNVRTCSNCTPAQVNTITVVLLKNPATTPDRLTDVTLSAIGVPEVNIGHAAVKIGEAWVRSGGDGNAGVVGDQLSLTTQDGTSTNSVRMFLTIPITNRLSLNASIAQNTITPTPQSAVVKITLLVPELNYGLGSSGQDGYGLGSSGQDGVEFGLGSSGQDGYGLGSSGQDGVDFTFTQTGTGMDITPDYSNLGTSTARFKVYNGGVPVADVNSAAPASIIGLPLQLPPLGHGLGSSGQDGVCFMNWVAPQSIVINGTTYLGNELRVSPLAPDLVSTTVSGIRVEATGIDELTLHTLGLPAAQWRMLPLKIEAGTLNVQWTGPSGAALESAPSLNSTWTAVPNQTALSVKLPAPGGTNAPKLLFRTRSN